MGSRIPSHQLTNGLYVSGRREQPKERKPTMASRAVPYTGGDIKKSGELGKMFDISVAAPPNDPTLPPPAPQPKPSRSSSFQHDGGSVRSGSNAKQPPKSSHSGPIPKKYSGPLAPTGLITSGPLRTSGQLRKSGPIESAAGGAVSSGRMEQTGKVKYGSAVTTLPRDSKRRGLIGFLRKYPDAELRGAVDGQFVKVTGVVTCGSLPLESSYQKVSRCVYISTELNEYHGLGGKSVNPKHLLLSWGCRHSEKHVADFYISDFQSGLRALVKAGYGAKVIPIVKPSTVVDMKKVNQSASPRFLQWLADRNLSSHDDRVMRLKEGYIKEGSTVSVMGVVRRHHNILMIMPCVVPVSTGCQLFRCLLPTHIEGLVLHCDDNQNGDVIPV